MANSEVVSALQGCELFAKLSEKEVAQLAASLADQCTTEVFKSGDAIFTQGEHTQRLYVILDGQVMLQRTFYLGERTATTPVAILGKGRAMGWTALLYGPRYSTASAICQKPTRIISIEGDTLRSLLEKEPDVGFRVMERLACMLGDRLRAVYNAAETHL
jgi:CRP/FNR family cyclic AMP-dependent transcriptional regulator